MQPGPLTTPFSSLPLFTASEAQGFISVAFALLFLLWAIYTVVTGYHWLRYGHRSAVAIPALITHVVVSGFLSIYAISGFTG